MARREERCAQLPPTSAPAGWSPTHPIRPDSPGALAELGHVDLLVHAGGVLGGTYARKQTFEQWRTTMSANLDSCFVVTHAALHR
jgi:NADP-dependent 3-hydroxy acid dehydrogenase YdfG